MKTFSTIKRNKVFLLIFFYFMIAGLVALKYHTALTSSERDGTEFLFDAERILNGEGYDSDFWPFGYMTIIAVLHVVSSLDLFTSSKMITFFAALSVLILTYFIGKRVFNEKIALLGMLILATNQLFFSHSFLVETDMLFVSFFMLSIFFLIKGNELKYYLMAGSAAGLAYMVKYGVYCIFPIVIVLSFINLIERGFLDAIKKFAVFVIFFIIFSSPWLINNAIKNGSPFYSKHYVNIAWGMNRPHPMPIKYWKAYSRLNKEYKSMNDVLQDTKKFARNWIWNIKELPNTIIRIMPVIAFFLFPAYLISFKSLDRRKLILVLISFSFLCLVTIAYTWDRYLLPIVPIFSIFVAYCLYEIIPPFFDISGIIKTISKNIPFRPIIIAFLVLISLWYSYNAANHFMRTNYEEYNIAGEWLKKRLKCDDWLMVPEPQLAWYAGTDNFVNYPADSLLPLEDAVKMREQTLFVFTQEGLSTTLKTDIDYFVYEKRMWRGRYPSLLVDNSPIMPKSFIKIFSIQKSKTEVIIYKIEGQN